MYPNTSKVKVALFSVPRPDVPFHGLSTSSEFVFPLLGVKTRDTKTGAHFTCQSGARGLVLSCSWTLKLTGVLLLSRPSISRERSPVTSF